MTLADVIRAIANRVESDLAAIPSSRVQFPGQLFDQPTDGTWARITVRSEPSVSITHGARGERIARQRGRLTVQCFAPIRDADSSLPSIELATAFRDLFAAQSLGADPVHFDPAAPDPIGVDGRWYQTNVTIPFAYDERI